MLHGYDSIMVFFEDTSPTKLVYSSLMLMLLFVGLWIRTVSKWCGSQKAFQQVSIISDPWENEMNLQKEKAREILTLPRFAPTSQSKHYFCLANTTIKFLVNRNGTHYDEWKHF